LLSPVEEAVQTLWLLSSFEAFDQLLTGHALDADAIAALLFHVVERSLFGSP